jgi:hypothetical protein
MDTVILDEVEKAEAANIALAKQALGALWPLASEVIAGYGDLAHSLTLIEGIDEDDWFASAMFLRASERAGGLGMLSLGRIHFTEAWPQLRRALEFGGFAWITWQTPTLAQTWLLAGDGEEAYSAYRKSFSARRLNGALRELRPGLLEDHERASRMTHASLYSFAHAYEGVRSGDQEEHRVHYFDMRPGALRPLFSYILNHLHVHNDLQSALARRCLQGAAARRARTAWKQKHEAIVGRLRAATQDFRARAATMPT